jgi:hypothetical protein
VASAARIAGGADAAPPEWSEDLQVVELGHAGQMPADLGLLGRLAVQEYLADRAALQPGHQEHPATALLPRQAVGEPVALSKPRHERGKVGVGRPPDLQVRSHEVEASNPVKPVYLFPGGRQAACRRSAQQVNHHRQFHMESVSVRLIRLGISV